jgi:hypothetical protein
MVGEWIALLKLHGHNKNDHLYDRGILIPFDRLLSSLAAIPSNQPIGMMHYSASCQWGRLEQ